MRSRARALADARCALVAAIAFICAAAGGPASPTRLDARTLALQPRALVLRSASSTGEYAVKAAFLYNFMRYVKWPDSAFDERNAPLVVAVLGRDPFGEVLDETFKDKRAGEHEVVVRRFSSLSELATCHMLFVANADEKTLSAISAHYRGKPVLVVADSIAAVKQGAQVGFFPENSKVRFAINPSAARRVKCEISSELLKLAKVIDQ